MLNVHYNNAVVPNLLYRSFHLNLLNSCISVEEWFILKALAQSPNNISDISFRGIQKLDRAQLRKWDAGKIANMIPPLVKLPSLISIYSTYIDEKQFNF